MRNEDTYFVGQLLLYASSYDYYEHPFYVYRKGHEGQQTSGAITKAMLNDLKTICIQYILQVEKEDEKLHKVLLSYIAYPYCVWMGQSKLVIDKKNIKNDILEMKRYSHILNYNLDPNVKKIGVVVKILGFTITSYLLGIFIKSKNRLG